MVKNIFLTGLPCSGKTSLIKEIVKELKGKQGGFYTSEIKEKNKRIGFKIENFNGKSGLLAHIDFKSPYRISKYGVNLKELNKIGTHSIVKAMQESEFIVVDEIGKMELLSPQFKKVVWKALETNKKIIGTIKVKHDYFTAEIKKRNDTRIFELTKTNRKEVKRKILKLLLEN
ncbi:NTPase [bacterium]|nr:NTPase [bacterium]